MQSPPLDPPISDVAPTDRNGYDQQHLVTYLRLLDADAEGADWREVAKIVVHIDQSVNRIGQNAHGRAIWPVRSG